MGGFGALEGRWGLEGGRLGSGREIRDVEGGNWDLWRGNVGCGEGIQGLEGKMGCGGGGFGASRVQFRILIQEPGNVTRS